MKGQKNVDNEHSQRPSPKEEMLWPKDVFFLIQRMEKNYIHELSYLGLMHSTKTDFMQPVQAFNYILVSQIVCLQGENQLAKRWWYLWQSYFSLQSINTLAFCFYSLVSGSWCGTQRDKFTFSMPVNGVPETIKLTTRPITQYHPALSSTWCFLPNKKERGSPHISQGT